MYSINKIARITLKKIYQQDKSFRAINFLDHPYDLNRMLNLFDTRTLADVEAEEKNFLFPAEFPEDGEIKNLDPDSITELYVWGIRLGLKEIPMLMGSKSIIDRIVEDEKKTCWMQNVGHFSHLVIERQVAIKDSYPVWEVNIYRINEDQKREIINRVYPFLTMNREEIIKKLLWKKFGKEDIKVSFDSQEFNLQQTGQMYFSPKKDVQFYAYEDAVGINAVYFGSKTEHTLARQIALECWQGDLRSELPTDLICVFNARSSHGRNEDGTFNCKVYHLAESQMKQIEKEYEEMVTES